MDIWENGTDSTGKKFSEIISFFPGVELKATAGKYGVHFLAIFPTRIATQGYEQKIDTAFLKVSFLSKIGCSESDIKGCSGGDYKTGFFKVAVDFKKTARLVRSLGGLIIVHHGNKSNSLDKEISHSKENAPLEKLLITLGNQKEQLMRECVDICELPNWNTYHQGEKQFLLKTFNKPSVVFSDSHSVYKNLCPTWIKADPTFEGLKQVLNEPYDRICIQEHPQVLDYISQNKPKYIQSVSIKPTGTEPGWFNDTIPLNSNLIAIIGNKGTGKSGKASLFQAEMSWLGGDISGPLTLDKNPAIGCVEKVKYLPPNFQAVREEDETAAEEVIAVKEDIDQIAEELLIRQSERMGIVDKEHLNLIRLEMELLDKFRGIYTLTNRIARDFVPDEVLSKA